MGSTHSTSATAPDAQQAVSGIFAHTLPARCGRGGGARRASREGGWVTLFLANPAMPASHESRSVDPPHPPDPDSASPSTEDRLEDWVAAYLERRMAGQAESVEQFVGAHPAHADLLRRRLESLGAAGLLDPPAESKSTSDLSARIPSIPGLEGLVEIGRGGMGVVYRARQTALGRDVAVKVLQGIALSERLRERFLRETTTMARIRHPHVASILDAGVSQGLPYLVMTLIEGRSLAHWLPQRTTASAESALPQRTKIDECVGLIAKIARALGVVHERGVIHRDVKPSNVLVNDANEPILIDFGLARDESVDSLTLTGDVVGTVAYMSPEQALGRHVDARADVYGAAATLYHLVTSARPYPVQTLAELALRMQAGPPPSARAHNRAVPRDLAVVLEKSLASDPRDRYATARELADDLEAVLECRPIRARRVGALERGVKWMRRRPTASALIATVLLACLLAWNVGLSQVRQDRIDRQREYDQLSGTALTALLEREKDLAERLLAAMLRARPTEPDPALMRVLNLRQREESESSMSRRQLSAERTRAAAEAFVQLPIALREEPAGALLHALLERETTAGDGIAEYSGLAIPATPSEADRARRLALVLFRTQGFEAQAERVLLDVLARQPSDGATRLLHAAITNVTGTLAGFASAEFAWAEQPDDPYRLQLLALHKRGAASKKWGVAATLRAEALELARRAIQLAPDRPTILNNAGLIARDAGHLEEAEGYYRRAIELGPSALPRFNLANLLKLKPVVDHRECSELLASIESAYGHGAAYWDGLAWQRWAIDRPKTSVEIHEMLLRAESIVLPPERAHLSAVIVKYGDDFDSGPRLEDAIERSRLLLTDPPEDPLTAATVLEYIHDCVGPSGDKALADAWAAQALGLHRRGVALPELVLDRLVALKLIKPPPAPQE
jgi:tetratricopeptide (TPR) repeat protein